MNVASLSSFLKDYVDGDFLVSPLENEQDSLLLRFLQHRIIQNQIRLNNNFKTVKIVESYNNLFNQPKTDIGLLTFKNHSEGQELRGDPVRFIDETDTKKTRESSLELTGDVTRALLESDFKAVFDHIVYSAIQDIEDTVVQETYGRRSLNSKYSIYLNGAKMNLNFLMQHRSNMVNLGFFKKPRVFVGSASLLSDLFTDESFRSFSNRNNYNETATYPTVLGSTVLEVRDQPDKFDYSAFSIALDTPNIFTFFETEGTDNMIELNNLTEDRMSFKLDLYGIPACVTLQNIKGTLDKVIMTIHYSYISSHRHQNLYPNVATISLDNPI